MDSKAHNNRLIIGKDINGERYYGAVDSLGREVIPIQYETLSNFRKGVALIGRTLSVVQDSIAQAQKPIGFDENAYRMFALLACLPVLEKSHKRI